MHQYLFWIAFCLGGALHARAQRALADSVVHGRLKLFVEIPVQFGMGYEHSFGKNLSGGAQLGFLSKPNSTIILSGMEALGTSEEVELMVEDAFPRRQYGTECGNGNQYEPFFFQFHMLRCYVALLLRSKFGA